LLGWPAYVLGDYVLSVITWTASLPFARLQTGSMSSWALVVGYAALLAPVGLAQLARRRRWSDTVGWARLGFGLSACALAGVVALVAQPRPSDGRLRAVFLDVAGDGLTLLESPTGRRALVGAAGSTLAVNALSEKLPFLDTRLDLLIVLRARERDLDGLTEIVRRFPLGVVISPPEASSPAAARWHAALIQRGIQPVAAQPGLTVKLDDELLLTIENLAGGDGPIDVSIADQTLELRLLGGGGPNRASSAAFTVVRLAPELALSRALAGTMDPTRSVVVGGRAGADAGITHWRLAGGEVVELVNVGSDVRLERQPCRPDAGGCHWP
jgi:hypothetical protein